MGLGSLIKKGAKVAAKGAKIAAKSGVLQKAIKVGSFVPGPVGLGLKVLGAASTAYGGAQAIKKIAGTVQGAPMPLGLPALPGVRSNQTTFKTGAITPGQTGGGWNPMKWIPRGPGGRMQLPWNDPSIPAFLKQFALDDSFIRPAMRGPRGYVIVRDADGQPYPVLKKVAQQFGLWKPSKKPPISVGDFQALKRADRTVKKMRKIYATIARVDKATTKGGKVTIHRKKGK